MTPGGERRLAKGAGREPLPRWKAPLSAASAARPAAPKPTVRAAPRANERLVDGCLELIGCYEVSDITRESLVEYAAQIDGHKLDTEEGREAFGQTVASMLTLIVSTPDFQLV